MKLFTARLTEAQRVKLDLIRAHLGCRSDADALRMMIEAFELRPSPSVAQMAPVRAATERKIQEAVSAPSFTISPNAITLSAGGAVMGHVAKVERSFRPHPKAGKK